MWLFAAGGGVRYKLSGGQAIAIGYAAQNHRYLGLINRLSLTVQF